MPCGEGGAGMASNSGWTSDSCYACWEQCIYAHEASYLTNWLCGREKYLIRQRGDFVDFHRPRWPKSHAHWTCTHTHIHLMCANCSCFHCTHSIPGLASAKTSPVALVGIFAELKCHCHLLGKCYETMQGWHRKIE